MSSVPSPQPSMPTSKPKVTSNSFGLSPLPQEVPEAYLETIHPSVLCHPPRIVINKATNKPKGTAFVDYARPEDAAKAAEACARGRRAEGPGIVLGGAQLQVDVAVDAAAARQIAKEKSDGREPEDKRCLYLAKEGQIVEGSRAWAGMSEHDQ